MPPGIRSWLLKLGRRYKFETLMEDKLDENLKAIWDRFEPYQNGW